MFFFLIEQRLNSSNKEEPQRCKMKGP